MDKVDFTKVTTWSLFGLDILKKCEIYNEITKDDIDEEIIYEISESYYNDEFKQND